jgi:uncharacterized membrane protein YjdF
MKMKEKLVNFGLTKFKFFLTLTLCLIGLFSIIYVALTSNELFSYFYCFSTIVFVLLPLGLSVIFRWKMNLFFYFLFSFYTMGPLLGAVYNFYYFTSWWDDLLHLLAGTIFAIVGSQLASVLNKNNKTSYMLAAVFGVLMSISIATVWEFYEYTSDMYLGSDMQADTIINVINTKINRTDGLVDSFINITETTVNGQSLGIQGYLDIGIIDTIRDLTIETVGAFIFFVYVLIDKNKHPMIVELKKLNEKNSN